MSDKIYKTDEEWKRQLTDDQYRVARRKGTEPSFSGNTGIVTRTAFMRASAAASRCSTPATKFESGTGWPSFWRPVAEENVERKDDRSWFSVRTEVLCSRCDAHLGHVFPDGPAPTGLRYRMNSAALKLVGRDQATGEENTPPKRSPV